MGGRLGPGESRGIPRGRILLLECICVVLSLLACMVKHERPSELPADGLSLTLTDVDAYTASTRAELAPEPTKVSDGDASGDGRGISHRDQVERHRIPRPQDIEPQTSRSRTHEDPIERPQVTQECPEHEMGRVDEEHVTFTGLGGGQDRLQFDLEKSGLVCNVLGLGFCWRLGDRSDPVELQAQILEALAHLAGPMSQPGQLKDGFARLGDGRGWLLLDGGADQGRYGGESGSRATEIHCARRPCPPAESR